MVLVLDLRVKTPVVLSICSPHVQTPSTLCYFIWVMEFQTQTVYRQNITDLLQLVPDMRVNKPAILSISPPNTTSVDTMLFDVKNFGDVVSILYFCSPFNKTKNLTCMTFPAQWALHTNSLNLLDAMLFLKTSILDGSFYPGYRL